MKLPLVFVVKLKLSGEPLTQRVRVPVTSVLRELGWLIPCHVRCPFMIPAGGVDVLVGVTEPVRVDVGVKVGRGVNVNVSVGVDEPVKVDVGV